MNDDENGVLLLAPLAGDPPGPPRIDVSRAMREGRRMRRRRWWLSGGGVLATATAAVVTGSLIGAPASHQKKLPPDPALPAACTVAELPGAGQHEVQVTGGDSSGHWAVGTAGPGNSRADRYLMIWRDGKLDNAYPMQNRQLRMSDINASGVAVGRGLGNERIGPYVFRNGTPSRLTMGGPGYAVAINDAGMIAGVSTEGGEEHPQPVRWSSPDAPGEPLPVPPGTDHLQIFDIAPDGSILGGVGGGGRGHLVLWLPDATLREIQPPAGDSYTLDSGAFHYGWIYGLHPDNSKAVGRSPSKPYRFDPRTDTWQKLGDDPWAAQMPGAGQTPRGQDKPRVWVGRQTLALPLYRGHGGAVTGMSDDAHVVVGMSSSDDDDAPRYALRWSCR